MDAILFLKEKRLWCFFI